MTDLIVGIASGYSWSDLSPFAVSLRRCGYTGACALFLGAGPKDGVKHYAELPSTDCSLVDGLARHSIDVVDVGRFSEHPSIERARFIKEEIDDIGHSKLRYVVCVDTKDVVFQSDPTAWLEQHLGGKDIVVVSEMMQYGEGDFVGNNKNMVEAFGSKHYNSLIGREVVNGGIIAGRPTAVRNLLNRIYAMCLQDCRRRPDFKPSYADMLPDQSALNILVRDDEFRDRILIARPQEGGFAFGHPLAQYSDFRDGIMYPAGSNIRYPIFHQYFNRAEWWNAVRMRYHE